MEDENKTFSKISGYLEKKGKMKMMSSYKKYWFVLEGRLLLYYRSKDEYEAISPCKGSINLGPPCNIKPCPSLAGVFQIETRTSTITLRAENREDQTRWMQGIMSALNQNKNSTKLSHFRYSLDELSQQQQQQVIKESVEHPNSTPSTNGSPKTQTSRGIIQRLQKIGAQSYGGSVGAIHQIVNSKKGENINSTNSKELSAIDLTTLRETVLIENDQYGVIKGNSSSENIELRSNIKPAEHIYERISTNSAEINYSVPNKKSENREKSLLEEIHCENDDFNNCNKYMGMLDRPTTFLLENETYGAATTATIQNEKGNIDRGNTVILENDHYCSVDKRIGLPTIDSGVNYTEPKYAALIDHNENNLLVSNGQDWKKAEENAYSIIKLYDTAKNNVVEYEDLDKYSQYAEPAYSPNEDIYSDCINKNKSKPKKEKKKKHCKDNTDDDKKDVKLKKSSSFIKRVWKKKAKHKEKEIDTEELYETVPATVVEKVSVTDETKVQMLSELYNVLELKKPILIDRMSAESAIFNKNSNESTQYEEIPTSIIDGSAVKMLSELQNILESKKTLLNDRLSADKHSPTESTPGKSVFESEIENKIIEDIESASSSSGSEKLRPLLPPKTQKLDVGSPYHDFPKNNQPINKVLPPKKKPNYDNLKSLDEILLDLDKEKCGNNKNKVKKLIKQFSEPEFYENDVVLRTNKRSDYCREEIDSDELSVLLNELAKVTNAPILTPGATTSLITPILTDEELLKLLPARRRRYSEPDYDIPRPHKSLTNLPKRENPSENVIGSTRFFGPILKPCDMIRPTPEDLPQSLSMTPDSLEPDIHVTKYTHHSHFPEDDKNSYTSHNYIQLKNSIASSNRSSEGHNKKRKAVTNFDNSMKHFDNIIIENDIYAQPKSLHGLNVMKGFKMNNAGNHFCFKSGKNIEVELDDDRLQDVFIDSLEV